MFVIYIYKDKVLQRLKFYLIFFYYLSFFILSMFSISWPQWNSFTINSLEWLCISQRWGCHWNLLIIFSKALQPLCRPLCFLIWVWEWDSSHNLLRRSKVLYKKGHSTFWNNKISIIVFHSRCCCTTREITLYSDVAVCVIIAFAKNKWLHFLLSLMLLTHTYTHTPASPGPRYWVELGSVCLRDCHGLQSGDKLTPYPTMHSGQVHLGVTTGLVPPGAISSQLRIWGGGVVRCQTMPPPPHQLNAC